MVETNPALGPANNYEFTESHFDLLMTSFEQVKHEINSQLGWKPIETQDGLTMAMVGRNLVGLTHTKYVVANPYNMQTKDLPDGDAFLDALMKEVKKRYKELSGNAIEFKKQDTDHNIQLYNKMSPDRSYMMGAGNGGYAGAMAKYLVTTKISYAVDTKLLDK